MNALEFANNNLGVQLDNGQGGYAGECVSLAIRVAHDVYNIPYGTLYCSKSGGARDLYEQFDGKIPSYFDRIANNPADFNQLPQQGDLIVWGSSMGSYGHVGVVIQGSPLKVYQQLGTPVFKKSEIKQYSSYNGVLGWLRPKVQAPSTPQPSSEGGNSVDRIKSMYLRLLGREADQGGINHYTEILKTKGWDFVYDDLKNSTEGQNDWNRRNPERVASLEATINVLTTEKANLEAALVQANAKPTTPVNIPANDAETKAMLKKLLDKVNAVFK